jgi:hypothetical protein
MKNSQYINQMDISLSEVARLTFNEISPPNNPVEHVITLCMNIEFLKVMHKTIGDTLEEHTRSIANIVAGNREMN